MNNKVIGIMLYCVVLSMALWVLTWQGDNEFIIVKSGDCYSYTWDGDLITNCYSSKEEVEDKILRIQVYLEKEEALENKVWVKVEEEGK